jgi:hypothetical protein
MNVVRLGPVRDLKSQWEAVRNSVVQGKVTGFYLVLMGPNGQETMYCGGSYKADPMAAAGAALKLSAARVLEEDDPPVLQVTVR